MTSVTITIDRSSLSLADLVLAGQGTTETWGIATYRTPGKVARISYAPDADNIHGSIPVAASWQQGMLSFTAFPTVADTAARVAALAELEQALGQFAYTVTVTESGTSEAWAANMGSIELAGDRTRSDMEQNNPLYSVTIPVYPIAGTP